MDMKQSKRKNIRQERKKVGLVFQILFCVRAHVFCCKNKTLHAIANSSSSNIELVVCL
jgi:ABC-type polar amino acid transport system ATPase subunit